LTKESLIEEVLALRARIAEPLRERGPGRTGPDAASCHPLALPVGTAVYNPRTGFLTVTDNVEKMFGVSLSSLCGLEQFTRFGALRPDGRTYVPKDWPFIRTLHKAEIVKDEEMTILRDDGSLATILVSSSLASGTEGNLIVIFKDLTTQRTLMRELQASEERFRVAQELSPDGFAILKPIRDGQGWVVDFTWVYENAAAGLISGTDPNTVGGRRVLDLVPGFSDSPFFDAYRQVAESGESTIIEAQGGSRSAPSPSWYRTAIVSMGEDIAILAQDISERKAAEDRLHESEERLRLALSSARFGIFDYDPLSGDLAFDERMKEIFGAGPDEKLDYNDVVKRIHPEDLKRFAKALSDSQRPGGDGGFECEYRILLPDDSIRWVVGKGRVYFESEGRRRAMRMVGVQFDLTDRKLVEEELVKSREELERRVDERTAELQDAYDRLMEETRQRTKLEEHLRQAQKMEAVGTLAGGIAHDFNNMLAVILGNAELAFDDIDAKNGAARNIEQIMKASKRARDLVKQILTFSRKTETGKDAISLTPLVKETFKLLRGTLPTTIKMDFEVEPGEPTKHAVVADPSQMQQVIMNLATNAAHAMRETGGVLTIGLDQVVVDAAALPDDDMQAGTYVKLTVSDTGTGMTEEVKQRIFEPFFTTKEVGHGTGMGLAVVYGIAKGHGGAVTADSIPGKGSTFSVYLPVAEKKTAGEGRERGEAPRGSERILVVDDEPEVVETASMTLERLGYRVTTAQGGVEAWSILQKDMAAFDLVITDQTMPDLTGIDLARKILEAREGLPIILFTGYSETVTPERAKSAGISEFVLKPFAKREVAETVRRVLDARPQAG
jgi:signal transduction histidine kinase/ActR/RegA family two-component response regulator